MQPRKVYLAFGDEGAEVVNIELKERQWMDKANSSDQTTVAESTELKKMFWQTMEEELNLKGEVLVPPGGRV